MFTFYTTVVYWCNWLLWSSQIQGGALIPLFSQWSRFCAWLQIIPIKEGPGEDLQLTHMCACFHKCYCCSVPQSCPTLCDPMDWSMPVFPVLHHLPDLAQQTHVYWVGEAMQSFLSHHLLSPSPPAFCLSQGLFQ